MSSSEDPRQPRTRPTAGTAASRSRPSRPTRGGRCSPRGSWVRSILGNANRALGRRCSCPSLGSDSNEATPGSLIPPVTSPFELRCPNRVSGTSLSVFGTSSIAANFVGSLLNTQRASVSPTSHLDRRRDGRDRERDDETDPVVAVAAPSQHADRVHGRDQEAADEVRGHEHVRASYGHRVVEEHLPADRRRRRHPAEFSVKPPGSFIHAFAATTDSVPADTCDHDGHAGPEVRPRLSVRFHP